MAIKNPKITPDIINSFLNGKDSEMRIVNLECAYNDNKVTIIYKTDDGKRLTREQDFYPFCWVKQHGGQKLYGGDRGLVSKKMAEYGISCRGLDVYAEDGITTTDRLQSGYRVLFYATKPCSYSHFLNFFKEGGVSDLYSDPDRDFLSVSPVEQFLIKSGKRLFKGYEDYDDLFRFILDLETEGLNPSVHRITKIGIRTNRDFEYIIHVEGNTEEELNESEKLAISRFVKSIGVYNPDVVCGHNAENFDWDFVIRRCEVLGLPFKELGEKYLGKSIYKKKNASVLKLGGEVEYFHPTVIWGKTVTDSLHAVRRAQAIDSNMKQANLKYVAKYSEINQDNRVYIPGDKIDVMEKSTADWAFCEKTGLYYEISETKPLVGGYEIVSGKFIVDKYLYGDLYECDKVELRYNQSNFLLSKILPTSLGKACTMGTAATWKMILLAWSYENNLAIPDYGVSKTFTGGLSRLLRVGYVGNIVKLDFNSLYPAITLTWEIAPDLDISGVMLNLLGYILDQREKFKGLMKDAKKKEKKAEEELSKFDEKTEEYRRIVSEIKEWGGEVNKNDKKQLPFKIFANSFFGAFGAPSIFPWGDLMSAENITCIGRQCLRLLNKWFKDRGFKPIVMDSVVGETGVYLKKCGENKIYLKHIEDLFNPDGVEVDENGCERDFSKKEYQILTREGWADINFMYRHKTNKDIYRVTTSSGFNVLVTGDHSLFNQNGFPIKPTDFLNGKNIKTGQRQQIEIAKRVPGRKSTSWVRDCRKEYKGETFFKKNKYVYDISTTDGTFVCRGGIILKNTDGCNFQIPDGCGDHKYIGKGLNRNTVEGKEYTGVEAYVAEFNDLFMRGKMGLGIDEYALSTINFGRKNYADMLDEKNTPKSIKYVGNTIKSRRMSLYIEKFLDKGIKSLLHNNGAEFINDYYNYVEKIYNGNIPLKEIASKGKIKKTLENYKKDMLTTNKNGAAKSRQAWYELAIRDNLTPNIDDTIYYVNVGNKKTDGDVKKVPIYKTDENGKYITQDVLDVNGEPVKTKTGKRVKQERIIERYELELKCVIIPNEIVDSEKDLFGCEDVFGDKQVIYNTDKYITQFNNRIKPLLVCFHPDIRSKILITNPMDRQSFTENECKLVSGFPNKEIDQDTFEQLMLMEDKEIDFWLRKNEIPVFINDCEMDWNSMKNSYLERQEILKSEELVDEKGRYESIFNSFTEKDLKEFYEDEEGELPEKLKPMLKFLTINDKLEFISIKHGIKIGSLDDFISKNFFEKVDDSVDALS